MPSRSGIPDSAGHRGVRSAQSLYEAPVASTTLPDWTIGTFTFDRPYFESFPNRFLVMAMFRMKYLPLLPSRTLTVKFPPLSQFPVTASGPAVVGPRSGHRNKAELTSVVPPSMLLPWITV